LEVSNKKSCIGLKIISTVQYFKDYIRKFSINRIVTDPNLLEVGKGLLLVFGLSRCKWTCEEVVNELIMLSPFFSVDWLQNLP